MKQKIFFNENSYDKLYPSGSAPACVYGTPKTHKVNYDLSRFLCDILSPVVPDDYSRKYNFSFISQIKNVNRSRKFLVSYSETSLFTNIPLQETIDIAINLIFNHNSNLNITEKELFAISQTHFLFNGIFYNRIDGVAMISPLVPVVANFSMGFLRI